MYPFLFKRQTYTWWVATGLVLAAFPLLHGCTGDVSRVSATGGITESTGGAVDSGGGTVSAIGDQVNEMGGRVDGTGGVSTEMGGIATENGGAPFGTGGTAPGTGGDARAGDDPPDDGFVSVFVALGHVGRIAISCDGGRTWGAGHSEEDSIRCWGDNGPDCAHSSHSGVDLIYANGKFFRTQGWGGDGGAVATSMDAITWTALSNNTTWSAISYGHGLLVGMGLQYSGDEGQIWQNVHNGLNLSSRQALFADYGGGRFFVFEKNGDVTAFSYSDNGTDWTVHRNLPENCGGHMAYGNGVLLMRSYDTVCRSADGGDSWTIVRDSGVHSVLWTGAEFQTWADDGTMLNSSDGRVWSLRPTTPVLHLSSVAKVLGGGYVAVCQFVGQLL